MFFIVGGVFGFATLDYTTESDVIFTPKPQIEIETTEKVVNIWQTKYNKCIKSKRILIPVPIYKNTDRCEDELEETLKALEAIKSWCNPYCGVELEECLHSLHGINNYTFDLGIL